MTKRKPLRWITMPDGHEMPDCMTCIDWLMAPGMAEAIASVSIEHPVNVRKMMDDFHAGRHVEPG